MNTSRLSLKLIHDATKTLHGWFSKTPIEYSKPLSDILKVPVIFKCEYMQPSGSFHLRGAYFLLSKLSDTEKKQGITASCQGSLAVALAYAAHLLNIPCKLYLPLHTASIIQRKLLEFQSEFYLTDTTSNLDTTSWLSLENQPLLMAATGGSLAVEIFKDIPQVKNIIAPIEHGDMMTGLAYYAKKKYPDITLVGCSHTTDPIERKKPSKIDHLSVHLQEELIEGVRWMLHHHQCLIDPSAAIVIAACLQENRPHLEGPTAVILSSRHIDTDKLKELLL